MAEELDFDGLTKALVGMAPVATFAGAIRNLPSVALFATAGLGYYMAAEHAFGLGR